MRQDFENERYGVHSFKLNRYQLHLQVLKLKIQQLQLLNPSNPGIKKKHFHLVFFKELSVLA